MAKAKIKPAATRTEVVEIEPKAYILELSQEEAEVMVALLGRCLAGGPTSGIYGALRNLGVTKAGFRLAGLDDALVPTICILKDEDF